MDDQPEETYERRLPELPPEFAALLRPTASQFDREEFETDPLGWVDSNLWF